MSPLRAIGQTYQEFLITKYLPLDELQSTLVELVHEPTGARVIHIANDDPENLFCLSFQTLADSSNGVAHILEHTVLCGSKKFPVKDPFFAMTRRSLNTFMNALTGQDFTCYPASSQVEKDFYNLLEVYLDAVFHPELKILSFLQEGHRLEFANPKDPGSPLQFQGVVYNEMKGSLSSSSSRLWRALFRLLLPDLPYAYNTGGDPQEIPGLTHEELVEFHKNFYHPSRCLFFFYGNLPLSKHLDFIATHGLAGVAKIAPLPPLPAQKRFSSPVIASGKYPIAASESLEKKTIIAFGWLTTSISNQGEILALSLLDVLLMDHDGSPLRFALLKSKQCTQAHSVMDLQISEIPWLIICKGCEEQSAAPIKQILFKTLQEIAISSFSKEQVEAALHQLEFERTEIDGDEGPFGLTLFMRAALIAQHGSDPENGLLIHSLFSELRAKLNDPLFLPDLIQRYLLDNPHFVQLTLTADLDLESREAAEERASLNAIRSHMTPQDALKLATQSEELAAYQEKTEHQSIDCLPKITLKDVPPHARQILLEETVSGPLQIFHHPCFTNHILYADLVFDLPAISQEDLSLVALFTHFLSEVGCGSRDYAENLSFTQRYTGGINAALSLHVAQEDPDRCRPALSLKGKALQRNSRQLLQLFSDTLTSPDFSDAQRLHELLLQHATGLQNRLTNNALNYAIQTSLSGFSRASYVSNQWSGLPYYKAVLEWAQNPEKLALQLQRIQDEILCRGTPHLVLSCDPAQYEMLCKENFFDLERKLAKKPLTAWTGSYPLAKIVPQVRFVASPVAFTAVGMRTVAYQNPAAPLILLSAELLQNTILHREIREKGGAYGAEASYSPATGNFYFYAYRDPQLAKTLTAFEKGLHQIANKRFKSQELEEAKLCVLQTLDAPIVPGDRAMLAYAWRRAGRTHQQREIFRQNMLSATPKEVAEAVEKFLLPPQKMVVSLLGEELFEREKAKLASPLSVIPLK